MPYWLKSVNKSVDTVATHICTGSYYSYTQ